MILLIKSIKKDFAAIQMKTGRPLPGITRKGREDSFWIAEKKIV
jgi:hypothetical protein